MNISPLLHYKDNAYLKSILNTRITNMEDEYKNKVLAEELAEKLGDQDDLGFYFTLAKKYDHQFLRDILNWVSDYPSPKSKGKLFTWRLKNILAQEEIPHSDDNNAITRKIVDFRQNFGRIKKL